MSGTFVFVLIVSLWKFFLKSDACSCLIDIKEVEDTSELVDVRAKQKHGNQKSDSNLYHIEDYRAQEVNAYGVDKSTNQDF